MINYNPINGVEFQINKEIDLDSLFKQASIYTENGNIEAAVKLYNKILKIDDKNKKAYFLLGYCYHLTNNFYEALKYYNQVLLIDNYDVDAYNNIGLVFQELKRFKEAEKIFKLSIKIDPSNAILYNNLSVVQKLFWKLDEATQNAELAVQLDKNYLDAVIGLPANVFYGTSIPTCILVLKKKRKHADNILFIDASQHFEKVKNQNYLREQDIDKIISTYRKRKTEDKYSYVANLDEVRENDYNLNIPRYVDTFEEEVPVDLQVVSDEVKDLGKDMQETDGVIADYCKQLGMEPPF